MGTHQENNHNIHNKKDIKTNKNYETFTIDQNSSKLQHIIHNFRFNYQQRSNLFYSLCPYEFSSKINKINNIHCHRLQDEQPQFNIHSFYEYKIPKVPILQSYTIPTQRNNPKRYTQAICILFTTWCTIFDIKQYLGK